MNDLSGPRGGIPYDSQMTASNSEGGAMSLLEKKSSVPAHLVRGKVVRSRDHSFAGLVAVGLIIAIYGLTISPGIDLNELASMSAYP